MGRLVNDAKLNVSNCKMIKMESYGAPYLCLFALRDIQPQEELLYFYGISDQPWYEKVKIKQIIFLINWS